MVRVTIFFKEGKRKGEIVLIIQTPGDIPNSLMPMLIVNQSLFLLFYSPNVFKVINEHLNKIPLELLSLEERKQLTLGVQEVSYIPEGTKPSEPSLN